MAGEELGLDTNQLFASFWKSMPPEYAEKFSLLTDLSIALIAAGIVYLFLLILIKLFSAILSGKKLKKISLQLDEMIILLKKSKGHKEEKEKIKK